MWGRMPANPDALSDESLLAGLALGEVDAATAFVRRFQARVFGLAQSLVGDPALAEDVAQEAFTRAWRHAAAFDVRRGSVVTWLLTITRNLAIDALRLRRSDPVDPDVLLSLVPPSPDRDPAEAAELGDATDRVARALASLPEGQRRALVRAAFYGRTAREISDSEGIPLGTAKTRIRSGLLKLRAELATARGPTP